MLFNVQTETLTREISTPSQADPFLPTFKHENQVSDPQAAVNSSMTLNSGTKEESAANDSTFPCSFPKCDRGFTRPKDLKRHKIAEHDWCPTCDIDCEDDVALSQHRISFILAEEGKYIACLRCCVDRSLRFLFTTLSEPSTADSRTLDCR